MSGIARWSYQNTATVWPKISDDDWDGGAVYGAPYVIACGYKGGASKQYTAQKEASGYEFIVKNTFWTESSSSGSAYVPVAVPRAFDKIAKGTHANATPIDAAEEIRDVVDYEMNAFGDVPDYEIVT